MARLNFNTTMQQAKPRVIKVFISSTFRDMNGERDYLNKYVFPRIHQYINAQSFAWLSGQSRLNSKAGILGDYIYFKVHGEYRSGRAQIYKNKYCPPGEYCRTFKHHRVKPFDWS